MTLVLIVIYSHTAKDHGKRQALRNSLGSFTSCLVNTTCCIAYSLANWFAHQYSRGDLDEEGDSVRDDQSCMHLKL